MNFVTTYTSQEALPETSSNMVLHYKHHQVHAAPTPVAVAPAPTTAVAPPTTASLHLNPLRLQKGL